MQTLLSIPNGFSIGSLDIRFYGIISAFSYMLGVVVACLLAKKRGFKSDDIITLACYVIPLAIIGARLYYVLFRLDYYTNFFDIFKIWEGGLAFYGGLIGGAIGVLIYCLVHKKNFFALADILTIALILCQGLGRWGNFFNQEAYGELITDPELQWFPLCVFIDRTNTWHMATFFYEFVWNMIGFAVLMLLLYKNIFKKNGMITACYLIIYGIGRAIIEGFRTDSLYIGSLRVSQILSLIFIACGLAYLVYGFIIQMKKKNDNFEKIMNVLKNDL